MADRNKEALLEVRQTVNLLTHILSCALNSMTYLGHVRHVVLTRGAYKGVCVCLCVFLSRSVFVEAPSVCLRWKECSGSKTTARNPGRSATSCYEPLGYIMCQRVKLRSVVSLSFFFCSEILFLNTLTNLLTDPQTLLK